MTIRFGILALFGVMAGCAAMANPPRPKEPARCVDIPAEFQLGTLVGTYRLSVWADSAPNSQWQGTLIVPDDIPLEPVSSSAPARETTGGVTALMHNFELLGSVDTPLLDWLRLRPHSGVTARGRVRVGIDYSPPNDPQVPPTWGALSLHLDVRGDGSDMVMTGNAPDVFIVECVGPTGFAGVWEDGRFAAHRR